MAVKKTVSDVKLQVRLNNGTTSGGNIAIKNINLNNGLNNALSINKNLKNY